MNYLMPRFFIVCLIVGSLQQQTAGEADTVCIKTHTGGCRNHKQIHISTVPNVDSVAICLNECRMNEFCTGFSVSIKKKVCILYSGECEKDGNQNWDYYRAESCMGDLEIDASGDYGDNGNQANEWTDDNCDQCGTNAECGFVDMFDAKLDILRAFMKCQCLPGHLGDPYTECRAYKGCRFFGFSEKCYHYGPNLRDSEYVWMSCERLGGENCIEDFTGDGNSGSGEGSNGGGGNGGGGNGGVGNGGSVLGDDPIICCYSNSYGAYFWTCTDGCIGDVKPLSQCHGRDDCNECGGITCSSMPVI